MKMARSFSGKVVLILTLVYSASTMMLIIDRANDKNECLCAYDGFGYYMYLPHLFQNGNLRMGHEWASELQEKYCPGSPVYQLEQSKYNAPLDIYHMGLSYLFLPSYTIAECIAWVGGFERDGFSLPYRIAFHLNSILFFFLGLLYLRRLLLLFGKDRTVALSILVLYAASNLWITFSKQYDLPHLYLFSLNAIWIYHLINYIKRSNRQSLLYASIIFGLTTAIRPTQVLLGILPFILLWDQNRDKKQVIKELALFPLFSLSWNIPQLLYWYFVGGSLIIPNLHTENIVLSDPNLMDFLFSIRKGWLIYSPIFLLLIPGFINLYSENKRIFAGVLLSVLVYIYIMSSWECWWYASSYGSRVMTDIYPLLAIALLMSFNSLNSKFKITIVGSFVFLVTALNLIQSIQFNKGILSESRMTKEHYWYIFGKININDFHTDYLLIDKQDLDWPKRLQQKNYANFEIKTDTIFEIATPLTAKPLKDLDIGKFRFYDKVTSFESQFEVIINASTSNPDLPALLKMEAFGRSNYMWNTFNLSKDIHLSDSLVELRYQFNLDWIRHKKDGLQIYIHNPENVQIYLKDFKIVAHTLVRK